VTDKHYRQAVEKPTGPMPDRRATKCAPARYSKSTQPEEMVSYQNDESPERAGLCDKM